MKRDLETSAAKSFFLGQIIEENLFPFPSIEGEEAETLRLVLESIDRFLEGKEEEFRKHDLAGSQPEAYLESLKELGLFGLIIPEEFGGIGLSNSGYSRALQQTSKYDASTSLTVGAHNSIGMKGLLLFGTEGQKKRFLPELATGERIAAFCLTEAGAGSDAASIKTSASKNSDGTWTLNGEKIWATNGPIASFYTVFARTGSEEGKMTAFIVERERQGVSVGPKEDKMGIRASATSTVHFDNVVVPTENVLGEEGKGFKVAMSILNNGRTGLGGGCIGGMKRLIELAIAQANDRKQFGKRIAEYGLIKEKIALMTVDCFAAESVVSMVGHYIDSKIEDYSVEAAIAKVFVTEALWRTAYEAQQIAGGSGFMREYPYERILRDSRINTIFEGTSEILRLYIALSGLKDAGAYLKEIAKGLSSIFNDPIKGFGVLSGYATKKIGQFTSLGRDRIDSIHPALRSDAVVYEHNIQLLSRAAENILRRHGKEIIGKQFALKRVANIVIDLFVGLCVLSRVTKLIEEKTEDACKQEISIARIFTEHAGHRIRSNLNAMDENEDERIKNLAETLSEGGKYPWDTI